VPRFLKKNRRIPTKRSNTAAPPIAIPAMAPLLRLDELEDCEGLGEADELCAGVEDVLEEDVVGIVDVDDVEVDDVEDEGGAVDDCEDAALEPIPLGVRST